MRRATLFVLLAFSLALGAPTSDAGERDKMPGMFQAAWADLDQLRMFVRKRGLNDDIVQYVAAVGHQYGSLAKPSEWTRKPVTPRTEPSKLLKAWRKEAEALLIECLVFLEVREGRNIRDLINIAAARALAKTAVSLDAEGRADLARRIRAAMDEHLPKRKPDLVSEDVLGPMFGALADLGDHATIPWILDQHVHADYRRGAYLVAVHKSLLRYEGVPGKLRHAVVKKFLRTYVPIEHFAEQQPGRAGQKKGRDVMARRLWKQIRPTVLAVIRHYATDARGKPPNGTVVQQLDRWFRKNKDPAKAPWTDPKKR